MSLVDEFQKIVTYLREAQEVALFATMTNSRWFAAFGASPLFFIVLPFISLLLTINAMINGYHLAKASNKNLDHWFGFITSAVCAALASVSLYGAALSVLVGFSFAIGPWFFFSSLMVAFTHQMTMMGINFYRVYEMLSGSTQRMHYVQAALNNLFNLGFLTAAAGSVVFVLLFPTMAPASGVGFAVTAVTFTLLDMLWRIIPHNLKIAIKGYLNLAKPGAEQEPLDKPLAANTEFSMKKDQDLNPNHHRLFSCFEYSSVVHKMGIKEAQDYLNLIITNKIDSYGVETPRHDSKIKDKLAALAKLHTALFHKDVFLDDILEENPLAFQSFWAGKGDVEQIFDAVRVYQNKVLNEEHCKAPYVEHAASI
jgi:hypothetical protein